MTNPVIDEYGQRWFNANKDLHREDGPAWIMPSGTQAWFRNGKHHRIDGPAIVWYGADTGWYVNNIRVFNNKEFQKAANLTDEEMTALILKYGNVK